MDLNIPYWIQPIIEKYGIEDLDEVKKVIQQIDQCTEIRSDLESKGLQMQEQEWALKDEQRLKEIESEEKAKLLEIIEKYGVYGGIIQGAGKQQFIDILLKDNDELKSFRKGYVNQYC